MDSKDLSLSTIRRSTAAGGSSSSSSTSTTPSATTPIANIAPPLPTPGSFTRGGRRLRKRGEKNYSDARRNSVQVANGSSSSSSSNCSTQAPQILSSKSLNIPGSPLKNGATVAANQEVSLTELQTSLTMYFGAVNRISNGEHFTVRGKRHCPDGRTQYLIDWETVL